jgi:small subunit ribosomal protein S20
MPQHKSAEKRMRKSASERADNRQIKSQVRKLVKKVRTASKPDEAQTALRDATSALDRAAKRRVLHNSTADRHKSRLAQHVNKLRSKA